jgi:hypothetical protein
VNSFIFRAYSQLRVLVEGYGRSDAEKNFVAAWNDVNLERFDIAWKPTGLRAVRLQTPAVAATRPRAGFPTTINE